MAQPNLQLTETKATTGFDWSDGQLLTEAKLDRYFLTDIETWADDTVDNINQIRLDSFGSSYTLDNDAAANFTGNTLFNKQTDTDTYTSNISLGTSTDGDFVDVDATNAALVFTPDLLTGDFHVTFYFTDHVIGTAQSDTDVETIFRITDSSTNSNPIKVQHALDGSGLGSGDQFESVVPVTVSHVFTSLTASAKTIKLQKKVLTASNVTTHDTDGSSDNVLYMVASKT